MLLLHIFIYLGNYFYNKPYIILQIPIKISSIFGGIEISYLECFGLYGIFQVIFVTSIGVVKRFFGCLLELLLNFDF